LATLPERRGTDPWAKSCTDKLYETSMVHVGELVEVLKVQYDKLPRIVE
jgi:hypothetical protein